jgi:hypothetical protein
VLSQVVNRPERAHEPHLSDLVALLAVMQALAEIDGRVDPATLGCTLEVGVRDPLPVLRVWPAHPHCGCRWPPASARAGASRHEGTMRA